MHRPTQVDNILELIGNTPLVRLNRIAPADGKHATVWGKCEMMNPGGSVKDRIALAMIEAAERDGLIQPGESTLVEPTSGNTGIGLALVCAVKGYQLILTMPESMSLERRNLLKAYGAQIVLTPEDRTMEGAVSLAEELCSKPGHVMLQQFRNPANPEVHRRTTGPELIDQMEGLSIDGFVAGVGTGGTITGVGAVLREHNPKVTIVAVEPDNSPVLSGGDPGPHKIQGIGAGFVPEVLDTKIYDRVARVRDEDAYRMRQRLAHEEGLLVGISAGAAMCAAVARARAGGAGQHLIAGQWATGERARELGPGKHVISVLCDTGERYFSLDAYFTPEGARR